MFVDKVEVKVEAGKGGDGALSFRHEKFIDKGGPDGGDGGDGGDVVLLASQNQNTLVNFRYQKLLKAENGQPGSKRRRHGKSGQVLEVKVPVGTVAQTEAGDLLADLTEEGQKVIIAHGGKGGFGNAHFVSSVRQAPRIAEKGEVGEARQLNLELKMIADVGLVGLPNAGKSTLLSVISNARPEIADYPFTTLRPNLGVVDVDGKSYLFADIPGLIEGASQGKGLGDEFLRHIERTKVLVHLIDIYNQDLAEAYKTIQKELADYKINLADRPQVVALTKIEGIDKKQLDQSLKALKSITPRGTSVAAISSQSGEGVQALLRVVARLMAKSAKPEPTSKISRIPVIGLRLEEGSWRIQKAKSGYIVTGRKIEKFARRIDFASEEGQQRLRDIMNKMGITRELKRRAIEPGQTIAIGQPEIGRLNY